MEKVIHDFIADLDTTFPEMAASWETWRTLNKKKVKKLTEYFEKVFPERFFDILYQNEDIFKEDSTANTMFLPRVDFKELFHANISEHTKQAIWKYLQLILLKVVDKLHTKNSFGETADLFQGVNDEELQKKMEETILGLKDFFAKSAADATPTPTPTEGEPDGSIPSSTPPEGSASGAPKGMPAYFEEMFSKLNSEKLQEHLKKLMGGKIGGLVQELMEEFKDEFGDLEKEFGPMEDEASIQKVMQQMMKNPTKFMGIIKRITEKVKNKMQEGNNQEEFMKETADMFKEMGGKEGFMKMFEDMKKNMPKGSHINEEALNRLERQMKAKDRMQKNIQKKKADALAIGGVLETTANGKQVFRIPGSQTQEKSSKETQAEVDAIMNKMGFDGKTPTQTKKGSKAGK